MHFINWTAVGNRIKSRRVELDMDPEFLATAIGRSVSTYYRYESGEGLGTMSLRVFLDLCTVLRVTPSLLLYGTSDATVRRIPVLGRVAAGEPILAEEHFTEYVDVVLDGTHVDYALYAQGDSMINAGIHDGDLVLVRRQPTVKNGDIAVVLIDDEATLKRFYRTENGVILKPENPKYEPMFYTEQDFKTISILGRAVLYQNKL